MEYKDCETFKSHNQFEYFDSFSIFLILNNSLAIVYIFKEVDEKSEKLEEISIVIFRNERFVQNTYH